jgi:hypothetical protein
MRQALEFVKKAKAKLEEIAEEDLPNNTKTELEPAHKKAVELLSKISKTIGDVQELQKVVGANKVGTEIPQEIELKVDTEKNDAMLVFRDALDVKDKAEDLHQAALDEGKRRELMKAEADADARKAKLFKDFHDHIKKRLMDSNESMGLLAVAKTDSQARQDAKARRITLETQLNDLKKHLLESNRSKRLRSSNQSMGLITRDTTFVGRALLSKRSFTMDDTDDLFDIDKMTTGVSAQVDSNVKSLQGHVDSMKTFVSRRRIILYLIVKGYETTTNLARRR